ncbi:uncharacterized protein LOC107882998 [Acyrthosiphon pisum]|uniref:Uncharacterized protein n=1 Tax=Acyrthosiphon pisum TaxID=7029 RepID=A0A8R2JQH9_ACYPI|nr:uncharacterized protein LOC107882998 [Acyrthosiphon pisum]
MIFFKCSLITFTTLIIAIWVMPVTSDNSKEKQLGDENSKNKKPGDIEPDVAKPDDVDPDIKFLQTGCKDLLTNYTDFRNDGENIDKEGTINIGTFIVFFC